MKRIIQIIFILFILSLYTYTFTIAKTVLCINKVKINKHFPIYPRGDH
ncbi:hypothetical protein [Gottfriedia acidiceleris]|nr:hypothetical protein [Gottfriedia acidiceleris]